MSGEKKPPIIKKIIKKGHGGHHGGSWKVAYADFVTALMAFFLVMWLLAISSEAGREALADYFNELTMHDAVFNGGLPSAFTEGGARMPSVLEGGCFSPKPDGDATIDPEAESAAMQAQMAALLQTTQEVLENLNNLPEGVDGGEGSGDIGRAEHEGWEEASAEQRAFSEGLQAEIQGSLGDAAAGQVLMEKVKGGLRIHLIDQAGRPMFASGGPAMTPEAKAIMDVIAARLNSIPNKISIEGHTDASAYAGQRITNWELSTARASAARLHLAKSGLADDRITMVAGYAATMPMTGTDAHDPINRRISIMIWDEEPEPAPIVPAPPKAAEPTQSGTAADSSANVTIPPSLPKQQAPLRTPKPPRQQKPTPTAPPMTGEELENMLIEKAMEKASQPSL